MGSSFLSSDQKAGAPHLGKPGEQRETLLGPQILRPEKKFSYLLVSPAHYCYCHHWVPRVGVQEKREKEKEKKKYPKP